MVKGVGMNLRRRGRDTRCTPVHSAVCERRRNALKLKLGSDRIAAEWRRRCLPLAVKLGATATNLLGNLVDFPSGTAARPVHSVAVLDIIGFPWPGLRLHRPVRVSV